MSKYLIYDFSGEVDEITHLFPSQKLAALAAIVEDNGGEAVVIDRANFKDLERLGAGFMENLGGLAFDESNELYEEGLIEEADVILSQAFDVMFVYLWHGTGFKFAFDLLAILKERNPALKVFGIGQKVDWFTRNILEISGNRIDALITGLGYNAVRDIVNGRNMEEIPNVIYKTADEIVSTSKQAVDVNEYPRPSYDARIYLNIDRKLPVYPISLSNQACPNNCVYCVRPENYGRKIVRRDAGEALAEIEEIFEKKNATAFRIEDSTPPRDSLTDLASKILKSPVKGRVSFSAFARIDVNSTEDFGLLRQAGFVSLFFGIESLDDEMLEKLGKGIDYSGVRQTLQRAHGAGLKTVGSFIFPSPGETERSMNATLERIGEIRELLDSVLVLPAGVYPPTVWGRQPEKFGIKLWDNYVRESLVYPIKYLVPIQYWKPLPFTYGIMGKTADEVEWKDILEVQEPFVRKIREEFRIPPIPDYYFLLASLLGRDASAVVQELVACIMNRNYEGIERMFEE